MKCVAILIFLLNAEFISLGHVLNCQEDDDCDTVKGATGIAKHPDQCDSFNLMQHNERRPCGFDGRKPFICCPNNIASVRFERKVIGVCDGFGKKPEDEDNFGPAYRIIGGSDSEVGEFPHFASLGYLNTEKNEVTFDCGGALISSNFVITAAHCVPITRKPSFVRLGKTASDVNNTDDTSIHQDVDILNITTHPDYKPRSKHHDIALIKLKEPVSFSWNIWPACIYPHNDFQSKKMDIAGFGRIDVKDTRLKANWLQKAKVEEIPLKTCKADYDRVFKGETLKGFSRGITQEIICAKNLKIHQDTCQGDSGSALQFISDDKYYIVGLTSFGISCNTTLPSFYTRVYHYLDWIESII